MHSLLCTIELGMCICSFTEGDWLLINTTFNSAEVIEIDPVHIRQGFHPGDFIRSFKLELEDSAIHPCTLFKQDNTLCGSFQTTVTSEFNEHL